MAPVIEPLERLDDNSRASVLFVLPWLRRDFDIEIDGTAEAKTFFKATRKALPSFAAITLKPTPGMWKDDELDAGLARYRKRIDAAVERYRPTCVVLLGVNFSKMLIPELKNSKQDLRSTFSSLRLDNGKRVMAMIYAAPDIIVKDHLEFCRMPEVMAKLRVFAERRRYDKKPIIHNLNTTKKAIEYIDFLAHDHKGMIGFDTETYSLNRVHHTRLGSMQFCHDDRESSVLLWDSKHQEISEKGRQKLIPHLEYLFGSRKTNFDAWIMHNAQFDLMQIFAEFGVKFPKTVFDTMLFAHLLDESRLQNARIWLDDKSGPYSLKVLVQEFLAFFHYSDEAMKARSSGVIMDLPLPDFLDYAGYDPSVTFRMFETFLIWAKLEKYDKIVLRLMRYLHSHAVKMYSNMSRTGINIDEVKLRELLHRDSVINKRLVEINDEYKSNPQIQKVNKELAEQQAESSMFFRVPWIFDMNSSLHRNTLFFHSKNGFKFPANEDGKFSADKKFQKKYVDKNRVVELFAEAQGLVKLRNAYIKPIFENLFNNPSQETDVSDKRVHPEFLLSRTVTGRVACLRPNTQQVPRSDSYAKKEIKSLFIPSPGKVLLQADLSAAEVRVWGALSGDEVICRLSQEAFELLKKARANPQDRALREEAELKANFHKQTYGLCYNMNPKDVNGAQRQVAKKLTFGICYGMSDQGLARELGVEIEEAMAVKKLYFNVYKGGEQWLKDMQDFALNNGYVETPLGRRRRMPQVFSGDKAAISEAKRFAVNAPIQATASDYAMLSTCLLDQELERLGIQEHARLINAVHDSVVLEVTADPEWIRFISQLVRRVFTVDVVNALRRDFDFELKAPIDIDIEVSQHHMHKCKKCGGKQYPGSGSTCNAMVKTGKKLEGGKDEMKICGHDKFETLQVNGWGYLMVLEENSIGISNVCKGINLNKKVVDAPPKKQNFSERQRI